MLYALEVIIAAIFSAIFLESSGDGSQLLLHPHAFQLPLLFVYLSDYHVGVVFIYLLYLLQQPAFIY